ncbi:MAG: hypothetical protein Ct9H90mP16_17660 [Candidatus Poseidoniales archaeon]|nr:MAG: hypothetical protein Ct9H90mP16_17660 [Candidatus Poseidoniales archaeon]
MVLGLGKKRGPSYSPWIDGKKQERFGEIWKRPWYCLDLRTSRGRILNRDASAAEFMDPRNYKMQTVRLPYDDDGPDYPSIGLGYDEWVAVPKVRNPDEGKPSGGHDGAFYSLRKSSMPVVCWDIYAISPGFARAWKAAEEWDLSAIENQQFSGVICLGMGGSASGGDFLASLSDADGCLPFFAHRGYDLPTWVSERGLVLSTSYSGNTEETIDATEAAIGLGCSVVGMSSGGALQTLLENSNQIWIELPGGQPPRSAFGHIFGAQVALSWKLGITSSPDDLDSMIERLVEAVEACDFTDSEGDDVIGEMAESILNRNVSVLASQSLAPTAYRAVLSIE